MRDPYRRTPQQSQSFDPTPLLLCNDISHCQMARRHVCAVALVPLGLTQPDTDKELVRCCLARMQHHRSVSVQTDSRHCHWLPPLGLTMTALYLYGSSCVGRHPPIGASVSYSGQYSTLWPWQPRFESGYRHTPKSSKSLTGFLLFLCVCSAIKVQDSDSLPLAALSFLHVNPGEGLEDDELEE